MGTVVGKWRLKLIVFIFVLLTCIYVSYSFFSDLNVDDYGIDYSDEEFILGENETTEALDQGQSFIDIVLNIGGFLTFGAIDNFFARLLINLFVSVCWIGIGYIGYTFFKEWIPFT